MLAVAEASTRTWRSEPSGRMDTSEVVPFDSTVNRIRPVAAAMRAASGESVALGDGAALAVAAADGTALAAVGESWALAVPADGLADVEQAPATIVSAAAATARHLVPRERRPPVVTGAP